MPALIVFFPDTTYTSDWSFQASHLSVWTALSKALGQATAIRVNPSVDSFLPNRYCVNVATSVLACRDYGKGPSTRISTVGSVSLSVFGFYTQNDLPFLSDTEKPSLDSLKSNLKTFLFSRIIDLPFHSTLLSSSASNPCLLFV